MDELERFLERMDAVLMVWWVWPTFLVGLAGVSVGAALFFVPLDDQWVAWPWGAQFGDTCGMIQATGMPCPQCGMTRSWVHGIRGDLVAAATFNPAGLALLAWIIGGGVVGAVRLATRDPNRLSPPDWLLYTIVLIWAGPLWLGVYVGRLAGWNPLP